MIITNGITFGNGITFNIEFPSNTGSTYGMFAFGFNSTPAPVNTINRISDTGTVSGNESGVGTVRYLLAGAMYGSAKGIFGFGQGAGYFSITNLVSDTGTVASDTTGVGTARSGLAGASYGP
mgnify:CR=1 FL=1